uniref:Uncharacterized protein n=1 Tax=Cannabis sativa TaxID=3483 RepID=A0A803NK82_CANSA
MEEVERTRDLRGDSPKAVGRQYRPDGVVQHQAYARQDHKKESNKKNQASLQDPGWTLAGQPRMTVCTGQPSIKVGRPRGVLNSDQPEWVVVSPISLLKDSKSSSALLQLRNGSICPKF